jgi:hypothetical protein
MSSHFVDGAKYSPAEIVFDAFNASPCCVNDDKYRHPPLILTFDFIGLHPCIKPLTANELSAAHTKVRELGHSAHLPIDDVGDMGLRAAQNLSDLSQRQDSLIGFRVFLHRYSSERLKKHCR